MKKLTIIHEGIEYNALKKKDKKAASNYNSYIEVYRDGCLLAGQSCKANADLKEISLSIINQLKKITL